MTGAEKRHGDPMAAQSHDADPDRRLKEARLKEEAATKAVDFVQSGMKVGLGTIAPGRRRDADAVTTRT